MCIRSTLQLQLPGVNLTLERERCRCNACGWRGTVTDLDGLGSIVDWVGWQDPAHVVILPEGQCPTCGTPVYNALAERRLAAALAVIGLQDEPT